MKNQYDLSQRFKDLFLDDNNLKDPIEIMKVIIYIDPKNFNYISPDNFTKEEYKELEELAGFLKK